MILKHSFDDFSSSASFTTPIKKKVSFFSFLLFSKSIQKNDLTQAQYGTSFAIPTKNKKFFLYKTEINESLPLKCLKPFSVETETTFSRHGNNLEKFSRFGSHIA